MMRKYLLVLGWSMVLSSCTTVRRSSTVLGFDYQKAADSLRNETINAGDNYIYFGRFISSRTNKNIYLIRKNSVIAVYKINTSGIYFYDSPYWYTESYGELIHNFKIILNDNIERGDVIIDHSPWFILECKIDGVTFKKEGAYYQLKKDQPLNDFIVLLERDLLNAEQDRLYWIRK